MQAPSVVLNDVASLISLYVWADLGFIVLSFFGNTNDNVRITVLAAFKKRRPLEKVVY